MKTGEGSRYDRLVAKYLGEEMSMEEMHAFEAGFAASEEDNKRMENLKKQWSAMAAYQNSASPDSHKAWDKLHHRLRTETLIPEQPVAVKYTSGFSLFKIAAVLLILLGTGTVLYLAVNPKPNAGMVRLQTGNEANALVKTLADGSTIYLAGNSEFSFPEQFRPASRNVALRGEAFFDVAPGRDSPFIIETDVAMIRVIGTAFNVISHPGGNFELFVDRGKVQVTLKSDPSKIEMVTAGEKLAALRNSLVKSKVAAGKPSAWYKKGMQFKDETLEQIIHVLNRNYNTTFLLADHVTGKRRLTVTFGDETPETMTELLCVTLNLKSQSIHGAVVLSENREGAKQK